MPCRTSTETIENAAPASAEGSVRNVASAHDQLYLTGLEAMLSEWATPEDCAAFDDL